MSQWEAGHSRNVDSDDCTSTVTMIMDDHGILKYIK